MLDKKSTVKLPLTFFQFKDKEQSVFIDKFLKCSTTKII